MKEVKTYHEATRDDLNLSSAQWDDLRKYVDTIEESLEEVIDSGGGDGVEEDAPSIGQNKFKPGGWVGIYRNEVTVVPTHISKDEYNTLIRETQRWVEIIGAETIEASLPLSTDILIDDSARLAAYSKALIELTETVRGQRLPVEVQRTKRKGFGPKGRPLFDDSIREYAKGTPQIITEETRFTFDTVLNHILVRFHIEMLSEMTTLADQYDYYDAAFSSQIAYHSDFINSGIPGRLVEQAIQADLTSPPAIAEARRRSTGEMAEVVDLWEAFQRSIGMELSISNRLNTVIKPISKIYEWWCLSVILERLRKITGYKTTTSSEDGKYYFGDKILLHYNRPQRGHSRHLKDKLNSRTGKPDFVLEENEKVVWIGDAKFKKKVRLSDYQRFFTYLLDLLPEDRDSRSTILYVSDESKRGTRVRNYLIDHISLKPDNRDQAVRMIDDIFCDILDTSRPL